MFGLAPLVVGDEWHGSAVYPVLSHMDLIYHKGLLLKATGPCHNYWSQLSALLNVSMSTFSSNNVTVTGHGCISKETDCIKQIKNCESFMGQGR